ncbi:hypothetical protein [Pseudomonas aeruginosa]|uniref:hypothetical protein n=1 Tax=Pseudomonas aeruginosa TaxID=287 RepID=UPI0006904A79|nr:hypothetical protein [Pseudomonas aeruginosa]KSO59651.1 hypothetical protein APB06_03135 [Pseudomonas aeruginosa]MZY38003.1 hypothetical protein [Pseudomonas aeruginosa]
MSKVKRLNFTVDQFESVVPYASEHGQYVRYADYAKLEAEAQALREEVAALRARVAVVPDASTVYAALDARERLFTSPENIQVALEAQSRLNGKAVSEGLLRRLARPAHRYDEVFTVDRHEAAEELRALLGEEKEHE